MTIPSLPARGGAASTSSDSSDCTRKPYTIGITGFDGTNIVAAILSKLGVPVIDVDTVTCDLIDRPGPAQDAIIGQFGNGLKLPDGTFSHQSLAYTVSQSSYARSVLESVLSNRLLEELQKRFELLNRHEVVVFVVPTLFESGWNRQFDEIWYVYTDEKVLFERAAQRNISENWVRARLAAQLPQNLKVEFSHCVIDISVDDYKVICQRVEKALSEACLRANNGGPGEGCGCGDKVEHDPECAESRRLKAEFLRPFGLAGLDDVLARLGDIAHVGRRTASSTSIMTVDSRDSQGNTLARVLEIMVTARVANQTGGTGQPCRISTCKCGPDCKDGCKCKDGCGCGHGGKEPPANPIEPPAPAGDGGETGNRKASSWVARVAVIAILVLTTFGLHLTASRGPGPDVQIVDRTTTKVVVLPVYSNRAPSPDGAGNGSTPSLAGRTESYERLSGPPGKSFHLMPNAARCRVAYWEAYFPAHSQNSFLRGLDGQRRLVIWQLYSDPYFTSLDHQYIVDYQFDVILVDRYEGLSNMFAGRTIYSSFQGSSATVIERVDSRQRPIAKAEWTSSTSIRVTEYDTASGGVTREFVLFDSDARNYLETTFYFFIKSF